MTKTFKNSIILIVLISPVFYWISGFNYLLYHTIIELVITTIGILIFSVSQIPRAFNKNSLLVIMGPGFLASSLVGILHLISFQGFQLIGMTGTNISNQFWIILSYILSLTFLYGAFCYNKKTNYILSLITTLIITCLVCILCFINLFPACYIPRQGLTVFKVVSEYIIIAIYIWAFIIMYKYNKHEKMIFNKIAVAMILLITSEFLFTLYTNVQQLTNFIAHYSKLTSYIILYFILQYDIILEPYKKTLYYSQYDSLTGAYNRMFFEDAMKNVQNDSVGIIIFDIDGLKLINDTYGHSFGDNMILSVSEIIKACLDDNCILARVGGDEFAVLVEDVSNVKIMSIIDKVKKNILLYNHEELALSISAGFSVKDDTNNSILDIYKQADDNLYRDKLFNHKSSRSAIVKTLIKTLETRDIITNDHSVRVKQHILKLSAACGISENKLNDIMLFAEFHDIGKVGIPDSILFKNGALTDDERMNMQRHCELGYQIAISSSEIAHISDWILKHHERWDGKGYPLGIKGEQIPIECRILSIVDSYDAMTNDRPYRKAMSEKQAIDELKRYKGTQFDPTIVELFLSILEGQEDSGIANNTA